MEIYEALWHSNPENVDVKAGYAGSLCSVGRFAEAARLIDQILSLVPQHPYANQLKQYLQSLGHMT